MRVCISMKDSPPGKRNPLGWRCTVCHSGFLARRRSLWPVHSPTSPSARSRSTRTARPWLRAIGSAVSRARSSCEAYTAATLGSLSMRAATTFAWRCPSSARCRPGACPGSTLPVVGVCPWRTRRTRVGRTRRLYRWARILEAPPDVRLEPSRLVKGLVVARVEPMRQAVAGEIERQREREDREPRPPGHPRRGFQELLSRVQHGAPARGGRLHAEAEE